MPFIGKQPQAGAYSKLDAITTSATATYNLTLDSGAYSPQSANHLLVSLNGVIQAPQDSFTVSGSQIIFDSALTSADVIDFIIALGDTLDIGVPSAGSVNTSQLANNAVTSAKLTYPLTTFSSTGIDDNATSTAMTLDSNGNLLVGTTNVLPAINNVEGIALSAGSYGGRLEVSRDNNEAFSINRKTSDGSLMSFKKNGSTVGSIGVDGGDNLFLTGQSGNTGGIYMNDAAVSPAYQGAERDNYYNLGKAPARWKDLYLSGGAYIGGTGSANKLEDYEEGTFTPTLVSTGATFAYSVRQGIYTKIGDLVTFTIVVQLDGGGNSFSGNSVALNGWPFASRNSQGAASRFFIAGRYLNLDLGNGYTYAYAQLNGNSSSAPILESGDNVATQNIQSNKLSSSSGQLYLHGHYYTDS